MIKGLKCVLIILAATLLVASVSSENLLSASTTRKVLDLLLNQADHYEAFKVWHFVNQKEYSIYSSEGDRKYSNFQANSKLIKQHNSENHSYTMGLGPFADLSNEEYNRIYVTGRVGAGPRNFKKGNKDDHNRKRQEQMAGKNKRAGRKLEAQHYSNTSLLDLYDEENDTINHSSYSNYKKTSSNQQQRQGERYFSHVGIQTPIRNQGQCGSCWAFSTAVTLEHHINSVNKTTKEKEHLSTQELIDCDWGSNGCQGGLFESPFDMLVFEGLVLDKHYKYTEKNGSCNFEKLLSPYVKGKDYEYCSNYSYWQDEKCSGDRAIDLLRKSTGSVGIDASQPGFQNYKEGIFDGSCKYDNHAVNCVGFEKDETTGVEYFIVRNSWSELWGDDGYIKVKKNDSNRSSCFVANEVYIITEVEVHGDEFDNGESDDGDHNDENDDC